MTSSIKVPGHFNSQPSNAVLEDIDDLAYDDGFQVEFRGEVSDVAPMDRAGGPTVELDGEDTDVLEIVDADGFVDFRTVGGLKSEAAIRGHLSRDGTIDLMAVLADGAGADRGDSQAIKEIRRYAANIANPEVKQRLEDFIVGKVVDKLADPATRAAAKLLVAWAERTVDPDEPDEARRRKRPKPYGVYAVGRNLKLEPDDKLPEVSGSNDPYLCLIHGTASHTEGGFKGLRETSEWSDIVDRYGERIIALEHPTLSANPAENALVLAEHLPEGGKLHLLTHSRGGLVGELLSLASHGEIDLSSLEHSGREDAVATLVELNEALLSSKFRFERFIRAGGPACGTLIASRRIDQYAK